jgi:hypothetical protein
VIAAPFIRRTEQPKTEPKAEDEIAALTSRARSRAFRNAASGVTEPGSAAPVSRSKKRSGDDEDGVPQMRRPLPPGAFKNTAKDIEQKKHHSTTSEILPEFYDDAEPEWWQQQQLFGWNNDSFNDGFDFGGDYDSPDRPDFPAPDFPSPHL